LSQELFVKPCTWGRVKGRAKNTDVGGAFESDWIVLHDGRGGRDVGSRVPSSAGTSELASAITSSNGSARTGSGF